MKILLVSDSHYYNEYLQKITKAYKDQVDIMIHCGDSSLPVDDPLLDHYLCVKGNHDDADFPTYIIKDNICIMHGHLKHVYYGYDEMIAFCKQHHCQYCFHGHTHVPTHQIHQGIHFINPGSLMMNRGQYGFGTFAIVEIVDDRLSVHFYHHDTFQQCDHILDEGLQLLEEFKNLVKNM